MPPLQRGSSASELEQEHEVFRLAVQNARLFHLASGDGEIRTLDPLLARQVLSQLSYTPTSAISDIKMGLSGLEPPTSRLSGVRSNLLSYNPMNLAPTCSPMPSPA